MKYDDLIFIDYKAKMTHIPMQREKRAAQFSPFAALTGYDKAIKEEGRVTEQRRFLTNEEFAEIELKLIKGINKEISITYFQKDENKDGGKYISVVNKLVKIIPQQKKVLFEDGLLINIKDISSLEIKENKSYFDYQWKRMVVKQ